MKNEDEKMLTEIIRKAIAEGKLFELVFSENGKRLWSSWPEERFKEMVLKELKRKET